MPHGKEERPGPQSRFLNNQYLLIFSILKNNYIISRFYASVSSFAIILCSLHIKGMWVVNDMGIILWLFWIGALLGCYIKALKWLRCSAFIFGVGMIVCNAIPSMKILFPKINWYVFGYMLLGAVCPKRKQADYNGP